MRKLWLFTHVFCVLLLLVWFIVWHATGKIGPFIASFVLTCLYFFFNWDKAFKNEQ